MNQSKSPKSKVFVTGAVAAAACFACAVASAIIFAVTMRGQNGAWVRHGDEWLEHGNFPAALPVVAGLGRLFAAVLLVCVVIGIVKYIAGKVRSTRYGYYGSARATPFGRFFGETVLMGTVQSVDAEKSVISITDADGNTKSVHINPLTKIAKPQPPKKSKDDSPDISSITEGAFVSVRKFNTETETIEAASIRILSGK